MFGGIDSPAVVVPPGYRIPMTVRGKGYEFDGPAATLSNMKNR
jgi:hypothetical protein